MRALRSAGRRLQITRRLVGEEPGWRDRTSTRGTGRDRPRTAGRILEQLQRAAKTVCDRAEQEYLVCFAMEQERVSANRRNTKQAADIPEVLRRSVSGCLRIRARVRRVVRQMAGGHDGQEEARTGLCRRLARSSGVEHARRRLVNRWRRRGVVVQADVPSWLCARVEDGRAVGGLARGSESRCRRPRRAIGKRAVPEPARITTRVGLSCSGRRIRTIGPFSRRCCRQLILPSCRAKSDPVHGRFLAHSVHPCCIQCIGRAQTGLAHSCAPGGCTRAGQVERPRNGSTGGDPRSGWRRRSRRRRRRSRQLWLW